MLALNHISTVEGLEDVSKYPDLFAELIIRGWTDEDLEKLAGRNMVRVFRDVEQVRQQKRLIQTGGGGGGDGEVWGKWIAGGCN